eukprot:2523379-Amphidinium_carterae.1
MHGAKCKMHASVHKFCTDVRDYSASCSESGVLEYTGAPDKQRLEGKSTKLCPTIWKATLAGGDVGNFYDQYLHFALRLPALLR